jgi:ABC-type transporter Mla MlaB component
VGRSLEINVQLDGSTALLSLTGALDSITMRSLATCVESVEHAVGHVIVDLERLDELDPAAMHGLVDLRAQLRVRMQHLECRNPTGRPAEMLEMSGVARALGIV